MTSPPSGWAQDAVSLAQNALRPLAEPERAAPMAAYLRGQFSFLGIPSPARTVCLRVFTSTHSRRS